MKNSIFCSLKMGAISALYFIPEIMDHSRNNILVFISSFFIQAVHDGVCLLFLILFMNTLYHKNFQTLLHLNLLHCVIMICFCYYKRCVLTLLYNYILNIDMCNRYIPIWQRVYNRTLSKYCMNDYTTTYLWLNNHILQSSMVLFSNLYLLFGKRHLH